MQRVFHHYDEIGTWQTEHGQYAEHEALQHARTYWNAKLEKPKFIANGLFGGSPDAVADDFGCDFKCPTSMQKWLEYAIEKVSPQQHYQCQMYMMLTGFDTWFIYAYLTETVRMGEFGLTYPVEPKNRAIKIPIEFDPMFPEQLQERTELFMPIVETYIELFSKLK